MSTEIFHQIALTQVPGIGPKGARQLIAHCGGAENVFRRSTAFLTKIQGIGAGQAKAIKEYDDWERLEAGYSKWAEEGIEVITLQSPEYPAKLKAIGEAPLILYRRGKPLQPNGPAIAIVGTRKSTERGNDITARIVEDMAHANPLIVSGLAHGIDGAAHKAALANGLTTIAVVGHGLSYLYPAGHRKLAKEIEGQGALLTEYPPFVPPDPDYFPARNRIVAAMCDAVLVIESKREGGAMITAQLGFDYNREVMAVPGRVEDTYSLGCNLLIKTERARLVESGKDILEYLNWDASGKAAPKMVIELEESERVVVEVLRGHASLDFDSLSFSTGYDPSSLAMLLLALEMKNAVQSLPGRQYRLNSRL